ncbi:sialidase family protein [Paenibacillus methanolicus]|uniref:exo-alpha-sialidase n=1 Tax=Paenibacillus methanolicus TaxID=582686 RepID=A0A5S5C901_9BACL|nr:sialidase family protein [Paenibacillus methanolicus]TYP74810.1 concanavalin A-like lectin/glucanase superfamily protein [Paenibacillus methanolicus]
MKLGRLMQAARWIVCFTVFVAGLSLTPYVSEAAPTDGRVLQYTLNRAFNGTSDYVDRTSDIATVASLTQGSIVVRFKTTSTAAAKTFFSASHVADPSSNLSLTMNGGTVYFENRENGAYATQLSASGSFNDGLWHTAVLSVDGSGTRIYVDGLLKGSTASTAFFTNVTSLNGMWVGRNADNGGGQWYYAGELAYVDVYNRAWSQAEAMEAAGLLPQAALSATVNRAFNGTTDYIDRSADLPYVSSLNQGAIVVKFKSTSTGQAQTFLSASNTAAPSTNVSLTMNNGAVYFENRTNGNYATQLSAAGKMNDNNWHTAILNVDASGTKIYVDGQQRASSSSTAFYGAAQGLNGLWVGRNVDNGGGQWYYTGSMAYVAVYPAALNASQISMLSAVFEETILFDTSDGRGYAEYRIPSIVATANGTILAVAEARAGGDQTPTDLVLKRSADGGVTFSEQVILSPGKSQGNAEMNPMLLAETTGNTVHLLWGRWAWGNCQYFIRTSTDNGLTWGAARDITSVLNAYTNAASPYYFAGLSGAGMGPGHGIQMTNGTLVVPIYLTTSGWTNSTVATIYSTDGGATWQAGSLVPNPSGFTRIHENMMVELSDGRLMTNMRNPGSDYRAVSIASGPTGVWSTPYSDTTLIDPVVAASLQRYDAGTILFTNPAHISSRTNMTIRMSGDDGATWYRSKEIYAGNNGYSDIAVAPDKTIFVFYEKPAASKIALARMNKAWIDSP